MERSRIVDKYTFLSERNEVDERSGLLSTKSDKCNTSYPRKKEFIVTLHKMSFALDDQRELGKTAQAFLADSALVLQSFWDRWHRQPIEQYVACDFEFVGKTLSQIVDQKLADGNLFCEWGCGFGVVTGLAALLGLEAVGIEAEEFLVHEARVLLNRHALRAEIWHGNFLPRGANQLADQQADHPSLFHQVPPVYKQHDINLEDFAMIFSYPWPGEEHFQRQVFRKYARQGALLIMFRGPYHLELYRKIRP